MAAQTIAFAVCANTVMFTEFVQISNQEIQQYFSQIYTPCSNIISVLYQTDQLACNRHFVLLFWCFLFGCFKGKINVFVVFHLLFNLLPLLFCRLSVVITRDISFQQHSLKLYVLI